MERARPATSADADVLAKLWTEAAHETGELRGGALLLVPFGKDPTSLWLSEAGGERRLLAVGETDGVPVGLASAHVGDTDLGRVGSVDAIYVERDARQVGVGEALMELVESWCEERGCIGIDVPALPGNRAAKAFFEGAGYVTRLIVMHHPLRGIPRA